MRIWEILHQQLFNQCFKFQFRLLSRLNTDFYKLRMYDLYVDKEIQSLKIEFFAK